MIAETAAADHWGLPTKGGGTAAAGLVSKASPAMPHPAMFGTSTVAPSAKGGVD